MISGALGLMMPRRLFPQVTVAMLGGTTLNTMRTVGAVVGASLVSVTASLAAGGGAGGGGFSARAPASTTPPTTKATAVPIQKRRNGIVMGSPARGPSPLRAPR